MSVKLHWFDKDSGTLKELDPMEFQQTLDNFGVFLKTIIQKFQTLEKDLGGYTLKTFEVSLDLKGTIFVITADGSVTLSFSK